MFYYHYKPMIHNKTLWKCDIKIVPSIILSLLTRCQLLLNRQTVRVIAIIVKNIIHTHT